MLMQVLAPSHMEVLVFIFMGMVALAGGLLFTTFAVKGVVFGGKDNDLLLSMPVPSTLLMASRVTAIYLENLLFSAFVLLPAGVVCTMMTQNGVGHSLLFWVRLAIAALVLPLLDTALSVLLGALMAFLAAKVSKGALGQNIVTGLFLVVVFYFSFNANKMIGALAANATGIKDSTGPRPFCGWVRASWGTGACYWLSPPAVSFPLPWWCSVWAGYTVRPSQLLLPEPLRATISSPPNPPPARKRPFFGKRPSGSLVRLCISGTPVSA